MTFLARVETAIGWVREWCCPGRAALRKWLRASRVREEHYLREIKSVAAQNMTLRMELASLRAERDRLLRPKEGA